MMARSALYLVLALSGSSTRLAVVPHVLFVVPLAPDIERGGVGVGHVVGLLPVPGLEVLVIVQLVLLCSLLHSLIGVLAADVLFNELNKLDCSLAPCGGRSSQ